MVREGNCTTPCPLAALSAGAPPGRAFHPPTPIRADVAPPPSQSRPSVCTAHFSEYYDEPTRRIVEEYMGADLKAFGYTFERA